MKTYNIEKAKQDFANKGINSVYTICVKTNKGNYNYYHITNGNSRQHSRFFDPKIENDALCKAEKHVYGYLIKVVGLKPVILEGYYIGKEVEKEYEKRISGKKLSELPPINIF